MPCPSIGQIILDGYKLFWSGPNHFGQVQIRLFWTNFYNLDLTKMNWTHPKQLVLDQNDLDSPKSLWTHRRTRQKSINLYPFFDSRQSHYQMS